MLTFNITATTDIDLFILTIGGLSIFLFGLNLTKENLRALANKRLEKFIFTCTNTTLKAFLVGVITTILIQSSSGVTAIVVSFIAAGYLTFPQGLGIMIGANLGTCTTAFLIGIDIQEWSFLIIIIASFFSFICKDKKKQRIFQTIIGVGVIFLGLKFMEAGFYAIANTPAFSNIIYKYSNDSFMAFNIGIILTFIIQSSSAIIGILEQLYAANIIFIKPSIALMLGSNIGTTLTGFFAIINMTQEAKKAVYANVIFNILGALLFIIILSPFAYLLNIIEDWKFKNAPQLTIATAHLIFNLITVVLAYYFFNTLIKLTETLPFAKNKHLYINFNNTK